MTRQRPDLDPKRCEELHQKIQEAKRKLEVAYKDFENGTITAAVAADAAEYFQGALLEYEQHCGGKRIK